MKKEARQMIEAITLLRDQQSELKIPVWYKWLDRGLALALYLIMGYAYLSVFLWLSNAK
tara:strand:+ start:4169 stop:4345 length:177 start_codon:yes stop_codon:yes gene_type:complete